MSTGVVCLGKKVWWLAVLGTGLVTACDGGIDRDALKSSPGSTVTVRSSLGDPGPDFIVKSIQSPANVLPGSAFDVSVEVCNQGTLAASVDALIVLSDDSELSTSDRWFGVVPMGWLSPGQCAWGQLSANPSLPEGTYVLGALADPFNFEPEQDDQNNALNAGLLGSGFAPDFIITDVTAPAAAYPYSTFTATVTICNQGTMPGEAPVTLYLSPDAGISTADRSFAGDSFGWLEPGQCATRELSGWIEAESEEPFYLGAIVDPEGWRPELLENNNTRVSGLLGVGVKADFIITDVTPPASARPGETFTASVTVCNQGTAPGDTDVELSLVSSPEEPAGQTSAGAFIGSLNAGQCSTQDVFVSPGFMEEGTWYLHAITNRGGYRPELISSNNDRVSPAFVLQY